MISDPGKRANLNCIFCTSVRVLTEKRMLLHPMFISYNSIQQETSREYMYKIMHRDIDTEYGKTISKPKCLSCHSWKLSKYLYLCFVGEVIILNLWNLFIFICIFWELQQNKKNSTTFLVYRILQPDGTQQRMVASKEIVLTIQRQQQH